MRRVTKSDKCVCTEEHPQGWTFSCIQKNSSSCFSFSIRFFVSPLRARESMKGGARKNKFCVYANDEKRGARHKFLWSASSYTAYISLRGCCVLDLIKNRTLIVNIRELEIFSVRLSWAQQIRISNIIVHPGKIGTGYKWERVYIYMEVIIFFCVLCVVPMVVVREIIPVAFCIQYVCCR